MGNSIYSKYFIPILLFCLIIFLQISTATDVEHSIRVIKLRGPISSPEAEISGLAWYGDKLILLPQYPRRFASEKNGNIFFISKNRIIDYLNGTDKKDIEPKSITFYAPDFHQILNGFEGYEAICFSGNTAFMTIEVENISSVTSYIIKGKMDTVISELKLDPTSLTKIPFDINLANMAHETLTIIDNKIIAIYEANGKNVNDSPKAHQFDFNLNEVGKINFPNIEYRITDATEVDDNGFFWAINYFYPGDAKILKPTLDIPVKQYRKENTYQQISTVEQLVKFKVGSEGIHLADMVLIKIKLDTTQDSRNWEGIVRLDHRGFLLVTDKFPETMLAFLPYRDFSDSELITFEKEGKFGYKDKNDNIVILPKFYMALDFTLFGIAAVVDDTGWVYINSSGEKIIRPFVVDNSPDYFSDGLARYVDNNKIGFFDESGKVVIKALFDFAKPFSHGIAEICYGCKFTSDGEHRIVRGGEWKIIDKSGKIVQN
ncbi:WG repeat-containing protein [Calditrichota bacterium]